MRTRPLFIAHRGNSGRAPSNTLISIQQAIDLGVDMVEVDINLSKDFVPLLIHDKVLDRTTDGEGEVRSFTVAELKKFDAGFWKGERYKGEQIPTLDEALDLAKGKVALNLDLKDKDAMTYMIASLRKADMVDQVVISGCFAEDAKKVRSLEPRLPALLDMDANVKALAYKGLPEFIPEYISQACEARLSALNPDNRYVSEELIWRAHLRALGVWTWTVDDESRMKELISMGVDAITSNWPERLMKVWEKISGGKLCP